MLQKRMNKETFSTVIERVAARLSSWKSHVLSLAGRITLTKAVLSSIPVHSMSSVMMPKSTLKSLDKVSRSFLWGSTAERRKQHLLPWSKVCLPKGEGGLGIRSALNMNKSLIAKVGWRVLKDEKSLWAQVVRHKYKVGVFHDLSCLRVKSNCSVVWRSIVTGLKEVVLPGQSWVAGDGRSIRFWTDKWLTNSSLADKFILMIHQSTLKRSWPVIFGVMSEAGVLSRSRHMCQRIHVLSYEQWCWFALRERRIAYLGARVLMVTFQSDQHTRY